MQTKVISHLLALLNCTSKRQDQIVEPRHNAINLKKHLHEVHMFTAWKTKPACTYQTSTRYFILSSFDILTNMIYRHKQTLSRNVKTQPHVMRHTGMKTLLLSRT